MKKTASRVLGEMFPWYGSSSRSMFKGDLVGSVTCICGVLLVLIRAIALLGLGELVALVSRQL